MSTKSKLKLTKEGFNDCPSKEEIENLLVHYLGQNGISEYEIVDLPEKMFWCNAEDTLVIAVTNEDIWKFGANSTTQFAINLANFRSECKADEFHIAKEGRKTIMRFWWD